MISWLGVAIAGTGIAFAVIGSIGILRLPDFYTRVHAAGKLDTAAIVLSMIGLALLDGFELSDVRLILIALFVTLANPAATHALGRSAFRSRLVPWTRREDGAEDAG